MGEKKLEDYTPEEFAEARERAIRRILKQKEWKLKNKEKLDVKHSKYMKGYYQRNRDTRLAHGRDYDIKNKEKNATRHKKYNERNKHTRALRHQDYYLKNRDKINNYGRNFYQINKKRVLACHSKYRKDHPEIFATARAQRRALMIEAEGTFTPTEFSLKCENYNNVCVYCGEKKPLGPDHVMPLAKGGNNDIENILPSCKSCNSKKHTMNFGEFLKLHSQEEQEEILTRVYLAEHPRERKQ